MQDGYGRLARMGVCYFVHVIVCEGQAGFRTPPGLLVRHLCGNKSCVEPSHLGFGTKRENACDAIMHGDLVCKMSVSDVLALRRDYLITIAS